MKRKLKHIQKTKTNMQNHPQNIKYNTNNVNNYKKQKYTNICKHTTATTNKQIQKYTTRLCNNIQTNYTNYTKLILKRCKTKIKKQYKLTKKQQQNNSKNNYKHICISFKNINL